MTLVKALFESMPHQDHTQPHEPDLTHRSTGGHEPSAPRLGPGDSGRGPPPTGRDTAAASAPRKKLQAGVGVGLRAGQGGDPSRMNHRPSRSRPSNTDAKTALKLDHCECNP